MAEGADKAVKVESNGPAPEVKTFEGGAGGARGRGGRGGGGRGNFRGGRGSRPMDFRRGGANGASRGGGSGGPRRALTSDGPTELMSVDTGNRRPPYQPRSGDQIQDRFTMRLAQISVSTVELPAIEMAEREFNNRARLYIGNLTSDATQDEIEEMFKPYGKTSECFVNPEKNFAFIRMDTRANADKARRELDGSMRKGKTIKVRWAPLSCGIKVRNLNPFVTNELLEWSFQAFGDIERAVVIADDRGKSTGVGIVEYVRKTAMQMALKRCTEGCFFVSATNRPVIVEPYEMTNEEEGYPEKNLGFRKSAEFVNERSVGPRFAEPDSFEFSYGQRWKQLFEEFKVKEEALRKEQQIAEQKLMNQMEFAKYDHETERLKQQLAAREKDHEFQRLQFERQEREADEALRMQAEDMRKNQEALSRRFQEDGTFRRLVDAESRPLDLNFERRNTHGGPLPLDVKMEEYDRRLRDTRHNRWPEQPQRRGPQHSMDYGQTKRLRY